MRNPKILILDEPTNNLDSITKDKFIKNLKKYLIIEFVSLYLMIKTY